MFSEIAKDEVARVFPPTTCCELAELQGIVRTRGVIGLRSGSQMSLSISTDSAPVARKMISLFKRALKVSPTVAFKRRRNLGKNNTYMLKIDSTSAATQVLSTLGILKQDGSLELRLTDALLGTSCCRIAYLRGAFLASGSVSDPGRVYHLEIVVSSERHAQELQHLMSSCRVEGKYSGRKDTWVVYLKDSDQIASFLAMIGAHSATLELENVKICKEMRNSINRLVNCEAANVRKTALAAMEQIEAIQKIDSILGLASLPPELSALAKCRLGYPYASFRELGEMLTPQVSKSCVNHRIRKLKRLAESLDK